MCTQLLLRDVRVQRQGSARRAQRGHPAFVVFGLCRSDSLSPVWVCLFVCLPSASCSALSLRAAQPVGARRRPALPAAVAACCTPGCMLHRAFVCCVQLSEPGWYGTRRVYDYECIADTAAAVRMHARSHVRSHARPLTRPHSRSSSHALPHACSQARSDAPTPSRSRALTSARSHARLPAHEHCCMQDLARACTIECAGRIQEQRVLDKCAAASACGGAAAVEEEEERA